MVLAADVWSTPICQRFVLTEAHYQLKKVLTAFCQFYPQGGSQESLATQRTLDLASSLEAGPPSNRSTNNDVSANTCSLRSVLTVAFQFPCDIHLQESLASIARQYVRSVISAVQRVATAITPVRPGLQVGSKLLPGSPEAVTLARWICQSYRQVFCKFLIPNFNYV